MSDNVLKKEFNQRDVQRLRNLIQGKTGDKVTIGVGYTKQQEFHNEGDVWEEDGRKWTIKDGIKQNITKWDKAKKIAITPLFCPNCHKPMKKSFDKDYFNIHKKCFDCVIVFETELRRLGLYEAYERNIKNGEIDGFIHEFKNWVENQLNESNNSYITEAGHVEKWVGGPDKKRVLESLTQTIEYLEKLKE